MTDVARPELEGLDRYKFGWADSDEAGAAAQRGLSEAVVRNISALKSEPEWMLDMRLKGLRLFEKKPMPHWGADLSGIDFDNIKYFVRSTEKQAASWDDLPADIKNTYDKLGIPEAEKQRLVAGVAAQYECLAGDSLVWTADRGQLPIKEIQTGDRVFAYDEAAERFVVAPVKAAAQTGVKQTYRVKVGARTIRATGNHPFLVLADERKPGRQRSRYVRCWKTLDELSVGDLVAVPRDVPSFGESAGLPRLIHRRGDATGPTVTNTDVMWLLGYYMGDGSLQTGGRTHRVQFAAPDTDVEVRAEITRIMKEQFGLRVVEADSVRVVVNSRAFVQWLQIMGFWGGSHSKQVPPWVYRLPRDERLAFLGGWIDADGYIRPDRSGSVVLTSVNGTLIDQARELAELAGLPTAGPWTWDQPYAHDASRIMTEYRLGISGDFERLDCRNPKRLARYGRRKYAQSWTSARGTTFRKHCSDHLGFARVSAIEPYEVEPVFDIEVDGPHNFIAEGLVVHNSEVVYHQIREDLEQLGVIFVDTDTGLREHEDLFREYFASVIPAGDNKFSALNTAVWSGGSFIYVPKGVHVDIPLQAYFRINTENMGQFERTLIIADEGSYVHYVEGCLPAGELITTGDGALRPIETIRVGDFVLGHDGRPHRVTATQMRDLNGNLHTFTPMSPANAFSVTDEHPLLVVPRSEVLVKRAPRNDWKPEVNTAKLCATEPRWIAAKDVADGDFLVYPKPKPAAPKMVLPLEFARLAGYYLAEGNATLTNGHESLCFSFHIDEADYVDEVRRATKELYDAEGSVLYEEDKHSARVLVYSKAGYAALMQHIGTGSAHKRLSGDLMAQDDEFLRELVRCYLNGDGNTVARGGAIWKRAHTVSREWAFQLQAILARLGIFATVELRRAGGPGEILGRQVTRKDLYQIQWTEEGRGPKQARDCGDYFLVPIKKRETREAHEPVFNLDVEEPDSYLAYGFAVHNCTAPIYSSDSLHSAVVEIVVKKDARVRYTTIQNWSNNVYNLVTKRAMAHEGATMEWIDGNLGCLAEGSTVTTPSGVKPIEEVTPGDQVLSYDEVSQSLVFRTVLGKKFSGHQPVREVRVGERRLRVTDNHPFLSYSYDPTGAKKLGRYGLAYVRADHLSEALVPRTSLDYGEAHKLIQPELATEFVTANQYASGVSASRVRRARLALPETTTDDVMWLFGAFIGDGSITAKSGVGGGRRWAKVTFSIPTTDRARPRLDEVLGELAPTVRPTCRADGIAATWNSVELAELIQAHGFGGNALTKRVPHWVCSLPQSQRLAFIAGVLDTDGCAARGKRGFTIKSANAEMLRDIAEVLTTLGITARLYTEFEGERPVTAVGRSCVAHGAYRLDFPCDARLLAHVSPQLRAAAKEQDPATLIHHTTIGRSSLVVPEPLEVRKVSVSEPLETVPTWDIEVDGTGNFVSQGFVVHNSKVTMKYPAVWLVGEHAKGETLSIAFAGEGQHQDAGSKMVHAAPNTSSNIVSKSVARGGGRTSYRGLVQINKNSHHAKSTVKCDALLIDNVSRSDTYPYVDVREDDVQMGHEATVSKVSADQLFYLMQRGIPEDEAMAMIVRGFIEPIARELPMEYALELNRLIELQMEGAVG